MNVRAQKQQYILTNKGPKAKNNNQLLTSNNNQFIFRTQQLNSLISFYYNNIINTKYLLLQYTNKQYGIGNKAMQFKKATQQNTNDNNNNNQNTEEGTQQYQSSPVEVICEDTLNQMEMNMDDQGDTMVMFDKSEGEQNKQQEERKEDEKEQEENKKRKAEEQRNLEVVKNQDQSNSSSVEIVGLVNQSIEIKEQSANAPEKPLFKPFKQKPFTSHLFFPNNLHITLLPGEQKLITEDCLLLPFTLSLSSPSTPLTPIKLLFTNYRLALISDHSIPLDLPLGYINKLCRTIQSKPAVASYIQLFMKNGLSYKLKFVSQVETSDKIFNIIGKVCYSGVGDSYAFSYGSAVEKQEREEGNKNEEGDTGVGTGEEKARRNGWICNMMTEYERLGLTFSQSQQQSPTSLTTSSSPLKLVSNLSGKLCLSYPTILIIPSQISEDILMKTLKYRSKQRLPILSYAYPLHPSPSSHSYLYRAAQPKSMNQNSARNFADEEYVKYLGMQSGSQPEETNKKTLVVYDIRAKQALINLMSSTNKPLALMNYKNVIPKVIELPSIASTRESYIKALTSCSTQDSTKWLPAFEQSKWLESSYLLLREAFNIAEDLSTHAFNVLVQCPDGTDRTSQLTALTSLILDPHYRTLTGFATLIEKEFVQTGYPFSLRLGWNKDKDKEEEKAPTFIQFLDCVYQLLKCYPLSFEFNCEFLVRVSFEVYSNRFGNFLCNGYQEMLDSGVLFGTQSIWKGLEGEGGKERWGNPYYMPPEGTDLYELKRVNMKQMSVWREHFGMFCEDEGGKTGIGMGKEAEKDWLQFYHSQVRSEGERFKELMAEQYAEIGELRLSLKKELQDVN